MSRSDAPAFGLRPSRAKPAPPWERIAFASVLVLSAALIAAPWRGHVDDVDAQLYLVVARNMAADRSWLDLRYLPDLLPRFREHLPFGFWPAAAALRFAGEWAVDPVYGLFTLATVALTGLLTARLFGSLAGIAAALCLGTCESIWQYGGRPLLDPPLLLFATAAAGAALLDRPRWILAAACGAAAVLVKGPFGLVPFASVVLARALLERRADVLGRGFVAGAAASLPAALFLLGDRLLGQGTWWSGYLRNQLLASATGSRQDGIASWWFPLAVTAGRFWPGLPLLFVAAVVARRHRMAAVTCLASAIAVLLLCLPARKWGNHVYVAFPLLAVAAGGSTMAARWLASDRGMRTLAIGIAVAAGAAWVLALAGAGRIVLRPPCIVSTELAPFLASRPAGSEVWIPGETDWLLAGELAAERRLVPRTAREAPPRAALALLPETEIAPAGFRELKRARGWILLER